jgi:hypothetical protein
VPVRIGVPHRHTGRGRHRAAMGTAVTAAFVHREVGSAAEIGVRNSQPEGIGRVVVLDDLVCWNNLGRNVVFADHLLRPLAVFGSTLFPEEDEPSQYDLDVHAILDVPEMGMILVLNHFGTLRGFGRDDILRGATGRAIEPTARWSFVSDVERTVAVAGRLVGSAPRCDGAVGLLVSAPVEDQRDRATVPTRRCATAFGEVTAVGVVPRDDDPLVALGGEAAVALVPLAGSDVRRPRWEVEVGFRVASLVWHDEALWATGPDGAGAADDYDWETLQGGGFAVLRPSDGQTVGCGRLPDDIAWGTGGAAVAPCGRELVAAGRTGSLYVVDVSASGRYGSTPALADTSLGIAHLAVDGPNVLCGFNRGGYRLHAFTQSSSAPN